MVEGEYCPESGLLLSTDTEVGDSSLDEPDPLPPSVKLSRYVLVAFTVAATVGLWWELT